MRTSLPSLLVPLLAVGLSGACGNGKVAQCNELIAAVNQHTDDLTLAIKNLAEIDEKPEVAQAFAATIETAEKELAGLTLRDPKVAGFAEDYRTLLTEAKKLGAALEASAGDQEKRSAVVASADKVVKMEDEIVTKVNAYCQPQ